VTFGGTFSPQWLKPPALAGRLFSREFLDGIDRHVKGQSLEDVFGFDAKEDLEGRQLYRLSKTLEKQEYLEGMRALYRLSKTVEKSSLRERVEKFREFKDEWSDASKHGEISSEFKSLVGFLDTWYLEQPLRRIYCAS
jgi:hypothetical protein